MKTLLLNVCLATGLALSAVACGGGSGAECDSLAKKICDGKDDAFCKKTREWVKKEMTGPDGKPLNDAQADMACKMIGEDADVLAAYRKQAEREIE